jgi:hypothetical protein
MLSVREPADIGGYPAPNLTDQVVDLLPVRAFKQANELAEQGFFVIVFLDELRTITPSQQAAAMKFVHEGIAGDMQVSKWVRRAAAANSVDESAGGMPLEPPMANRWAHIFTSPNAMEWAEDMRLNTYALQSSLSKEATKRLPMERSLVATFIARKPSMLLMVPKDEDKRDGPWPSPRTWDYAAHAWAAAATEDLDFRMELLAGCVGVETAGMFIKWRESFDLPDPEELLDGSYKGKIQDEDRPDRTYTILSAVVSAVADTWTPKRYEQAWSIHAKAAQEGAGDIAAATVGTLMRTAQDKRDVPSIAKHAQGFADFLRRAGWKAS